MFLCLHFCALAQTDSTKQANDKAPVIIDESQSEADSAKMAFVYKRFNPQKALLYAAILPGSGQVYNKKYWKIPIIYGALGISGSVFVFNLQNYRDLRFAYKAKYEAQPKSNSAGQTIPGDSTNYFKIKPELMPLDMNALRTYRDEYRRNIDYSALFFILLWGLNVVDATVVAHLKSFEESPDLSFHMKFGHSQMAGTTGFSFVIALR